MEEGHLEHRIALFADDVILMIKNLHRSIPALLILIETKYPVIKLITQSSIMLLKKIVLYMLLLSIQQIILHIWE